jgi:hypothetical protein
VASMIIDEWLSASHRTILLELHQSLGKEADSVGTAQTRRQLQCVA